MAWDWRGVPLVRLMMVLLVQDGVLAVMKEDKIVS